MLQKEKFTGEEMFTLREFSAVNMKNCGCHNVRKYREIKCSDKYVTLKYCVGNTHLEDQLIHILLNKFHHGGKYAS